MSGYRKNSLVALSLVMMMTLLCTGTALAQPGGGGGGKPPIEVSVTYGSMWGGNIQAYNGKLRTATGPSYGIALDIPLQPAMSLELSYTRQDGGLNWDSMGTTTELTDMSVNYWQIGAIRGLIDGAVRPFVTTSLGATYYSPSSSTVEIDDTTYNISTMTKFSFVIGVGVKAYFGEAEKIGLRASFKTLPTIYNAGGGAWFGSGGASVGVTGSTIWQWEAAIGLTVKLG